MNNLVFKIETIPDIEGGQKIYDLAGLDDKSTAKAIFHIHQQKTASEVLPLYLQKIVSISVVYRGLGDDMNKQITISSFGDETTSEAKLLNLFFEEIDKRKPEMISWQGADFDLPIIRYRALKYGITLPHHWREDPYFSDMKAMLAGSYPDTGAPLNHLAKLLGFPSAEANDIWDEFQEGNLNVIRENAELDAINTYLIYLRYLLMDGHIEQETLEQEFTLLRDALESQSEMGHKHLGAFLKAW